jgi:hypothetical protein
MVEHLVMAVQPQEVIQEEVEGAYLVMELEITVG